jgi:hypothetical protein
MPKGFPPSVFVSSTCYDLNQVRADLKGFLTEMGFDPVLSETPIFPVSPQIGPIENCLQAVRERADVFILIIGLRYGSQNESGKSITNLEYLEAKAKGLPIYVFVLKQILDLIPVWKENPQNSFNGIVDSTKLFEFVEALQSSQDHWIYPFEEVLHIMGTLRNQLAILFMEGLVLREKVKDLKLPPSLIKLRGKPLRLLLERPSGWEYLFFSAVMAWEMRRDQDLKWDLHHGLKIKSIQIFENLLLMNEWILKKIQECQMFSHSFDTLMNAAMQEAVGSPGVHGNPEYLAYVARRLAGVRKALLEWSIEFNCVEVRPECERLLFLISEMSKGFIEQIENIPSRIDAEVSKALEAKKRGEVYEANVMVILSETGNMAEIEAEFQKLPTLV